MEKKRDKICHIFGAGDQTVQNPAELINLAHEKLIVAADGGTEFLRKNNIIPDVILGDFDSLGAVPEGNNVKIFPSEKDDTDTMLAIKEGFSQSCGTFIIYGGTGGERFDHTVSNMCALCYIAKEGGQGYLLGNNYIVTLLDSSSFTLPSHLTGYLSVFAADTSVSGLTIEGLKYTLKNGTLTNSFPLGTSNSFIGKDAKISVAQGSIYIIWQENPKDFVRRVIKRL